MSAKQKSQQESINTISELQQIEFTIKANWI